MPVRAGRGFILRPSRPRFVRLPAVEPWGPAGTYATAVLVDTPAAYWRLDETVGSTVRDYSGNGRNGTFFGPVTRGVSGLIATDSNLAAQFVSSSDDVRIVRASWMDVGNQISVEALIRPTTLGVTRDIFSLGNTINSQSKFLLQVLTTGELTFRVSSSTSGTTATTTTAGLVINTIYHVVGTYDGATAKIYVNGVEKISVAGAFATLNAGTVANMTIGSGANSDFVGKIDEVAYYGSALSAARVLAHYNSTLFSIASRKPQLAYQRFAAASQNSWR